MAGKGDNQAVVIDNGTYMIRAGLAGDDEPKVSFPNAIGRPADGSGGEFIGKQVQAKLDILNTKSPIEKGLVTNWDDMEKIWEHTYSQELKMKSSDLPVILTERPGNTKENREKMAEIMFEKFKVPALFSGIQAVLSLYASGRMSGMVIDSGEEVTHVVPVFSGYAVPDGIVSMDLGGRHVTNKLRDLLNAKGHKFSSPSELDLVRQMKEAVCYVAEDYEAEAKKDEAAITQSYKLPDGKEIKLAREAYECTEGLFQPTKCGQSGPGLVELVKQSIAKCDMDVRKDMLANTILAGGNTMFRSLNDRLKKQLSEISNKPVKVVAHQDRDRVVWIGASILSNLPTFKDIAVSMKEYEEGGAAAIHKKF